jgi:hypothetical protein
MQNSNVIPLAPVLERRRRVVISVGPASWSNNFPQGIEDLWSGPFARATPAVVVQLRVA